MEVPQVGQKIFPWHQKQEYYSFITPEAYSALKEWMDFRLEYGEKISGESWVMRDIWQTTNVTYGAKWGLATAPKRLHSRAIKRLIERALWEQGIRVPLARGKNRHEWKAAHSIRKYYKTKAEQVMRPANVEITLGHDIGISKRYGLISPVRPARNFSTDSCFDIRIRSILVTADFSILICVFIIH